MDRYVRDHRSQSRERHRYSGGLDSYVPSTREPRPRSRSAGRYRPRSRSPPRMHADTWRGRPRSRTPTDRRDNRYDARYDDSQRSRDYGRYDERARSPRGRSATYQRDDHESADYGRARRYDNKWNARSIEPSAEKPSEHDTSEKHTFEKHTPARQTPARQTPARHTPERHTPARHTPARQTPARHTPASHTPARDTPAGDTPAGDMPAGDMPAKNTSEKHTSEKRTSEKHTSEKQKSKSMLPPKRRPFQAKHYDSFIPSYSRLNTSHRPTDRSEYRRRSRSQLRRDERAEVYIAQQRRNTPSPRPARREHRSAEDSRATSRRSSPRPFNPSQFRADDNGHYRMPLHIKQELTASPVPVPMVQSQIRDNGRAYESHPRQDLDRAHYYQQPHEAYPPARDDREPPTGPAYRDPRATAIGLSPAPATPLVSISAHNQALSNTIPTEPRGGSYRGRGGGIPPPPPPPPVEYAPRDYTPTGPSRGGRGGRGGWRGHYQQGATSTHEAGFHFDTRRAPQPPHADAMGAPPPPFRNSNSTSTTYPRSQRFNAAGAPVQPYPSVADKYLSDLPKILPGGERLPALYDMTKAERLEEEAARIRKTIDEKQARKRAGLREWDRLERESNSARLRTDLAEEASRKLTGEEDGFGSGGGLAF